MATMSIKAFLSEWRGMEARAQLVVLDELALAAQSYVSRASIPPRSDLPPSIAEAHQVRRGVYTDAAGCMSSVRALLTREAAK